MNSTYFSVDYCKKATSPTVKFLVLSLLLLSCKTTNQGSTPAGAAAAACPMPAVVAYSQPTAAAAEASKKPLIPAGAAINVGLLDLINIQVTPDDFKNLDDNVCKSDGTCKATLTKPIKVDVNVPVSLMGKLSVGYEQAHGDTPGVCLRNAHVGAKITPICLGKILNFSINMGVAVSKKDDTINHKVTYDAEPYCNANFSCSIPFLSASAQMDQNGLTFDSSASAQTGMPNMLVKVSAPTTKSSTFAFAKLPDSIRRLKEYFKPTGANLLANANSNAAAPDIYWENFATCD